MTVQKLKTRDGKAETTTLIAQGIISAERKARDAKTLRLRALREEAEVKQAEILAIEEQTNPKPAPKPRARRASTKAQPASLQA